MNNTTPFVGHDAHTHSKKTYAFASATGEVERKSLGYEPGELASWIKPRSSPRDAFTSRLAASTCTASCPTGFWWKQIGSRAKSTVLDPSAPINNVRLIKKSGRLDHTSTLARRSTNAHSINRQNQFNYAVSNESPSLPTLQLRGSPLTLVSARRSRCPAAIATRSRCRVDSTA